MNVRHPLGFAFFSVFLLAFTPSSYPFTQFDVALPLSYSQERSVILSKNRLDKAIHNPEYMLNHWVNMPNAQSTIHKTTVNLSLREAILLALRYNPNIQSAELDRIIQRYQLRLAHNAYELQYALAGTAMATNASYSGIGSARTKSYLATPEFNLRNIYGLETSLGMDNNVNTDGNYNPLVHFSLRQPLLRGFGRKANTVGLMDSIDREYLNKLSLNQSVMDQITQVIFAYRAVILNTHNLQIQQRQLKEASEAYAINQKKIDAGQLESSVNIQQSYQIESLGLINEQEEQELKTSTQDLLQAIGLNPDTPLSIVSDLKVETFSIPDSKSATNQALKHNTQYLALKMLIQTDERAYEAEKNQQLWQLDATANVQSGTTTNVDNNSAGLRNVYSGHNITEVVGLTLKIPLEDLNRRSGLILAKIKLEKDRINLIAAEQILITTIKNAITVLQSLEKRYHYAERQITLAEKSYELEKKKQQAGIASALDVNNTQNQWIQSQMGLISAKIAYLNQLSNLQRLLGTTLEYWHITLRYSG